MDYVHVHNVEVLGYRDVLLLNDHLDGEVKVLEQHNFSLAHEDFDDDLFDDGFDEDLALEEV